MNVGRRKLISSEDANRFLPKYNRKTKCFRSTYYSYLFIGRRKVVDVLTLIVGDKSP